MAGEGLALLEQPESLDGRRRVDDEGGDLDGGEDELDGEVADVVDKVLGHHGARVLQCEASVLGVAQGLQDLGAAL